MTGTTLQKFKSTKTLPGYQHNNLTVQLESIACLMGCLDTTAFTFHSSACQNYSDTYYVKKTEKKASFRSGLVAKTTLGQYNASATTDQLTGLFATTDIIRD